jgi:soluble lytic murein transglycosylase-like protein
MGLMQLMPALAKYYSVDDPFDPEQNLTAGLQHLQTLLDRFGDDTATAPRGVQRRRAGGGEDTADPAVS